MKEPISSKTIFFLYLVMIWSIVIFIVGTQCGIRSAYMKTARGEVTPVLEGKSYKLIVNTK